MTQAVKAQLRIDPLRRSLGFDLSDLEANRQGVLTRKQVVRLLPGLLKYFAAALVIYGFVIFLLYSLSYRGGRLIFQPLVLIEILACMVVPGLLAAALVLLGRNVALDIFERRVFSIMGVGCVPVEPRRDGGGADSGGANSGEKSSGCIMIGPAKFAVSQKVISYFVEGLVYRAYFAPHSGILLSIEPCDRPNDWGG